VSLVYCCYIRYCDDFLLLSKDPDQLADYHRRIEEFLQTKLLLELNPSQYRLRPVSSGIDFLGYIVRRRYVLVRRRVVNHFREKLEDFEEKLSTRERGQLLEWKYPTDTVEQLRAVTDSYLGHFGWANSSNLTTKLFEKNPVLRACFMPGKNLPLRISPRYTPPKTVKQRLHQEYRWWVRPAPRLVDCAKNISYQPFPLWTGDQLQQNILIFFPVGTFYEFYNGQAEIACHILGLKLMAGMRGFRCGCGFHRRLLRHYLTEARVHGFYVALLGINNRQSTYPGRRRLVRLTSCH
jgi:hypothetical protein